LKLESGRFFAKKRRKKLFFAWARGAEASTAQHKQKFWRRFF
jgi:hypothetical protein